MLETLRDKVDEWVNPATIRGISLAAAGLIALAVPDISTRLLGLVIAGALIFTGVTDLWAEYRSRKPSWQGIVIGTIWLVAGVGLVFYSDAAVSVLSKVLGLLSALRGTAIFLRAIRARATSESWVFDTVRGLLYIAVGAIFVFIPDAFISGLVVVVALTAVISGGILISFGLTNPDEADLTPTDLGGLVKRWLQQRDVGDEMRDDVVDNLFFEEPEATQKQIGFWVLLVLSVVIATLGVLADSTAVVIGAMLVAPLMTPIMAVSAGIVNGWVRRVSTAFATVAGGVAAAVAVAYLVAAWTPQLVPLASNSQILSRTSPTLIDLMIAVAAGAAGAYATVDRRVSSSITGVAIAVALVPPLGVVGIMLQAGAVSDAMGAFLLFLTNLVSIVLVGSLVFLLAGLAPIADLRQNKEKMRTVIMTVILSAVLIIVPLAFTSEGIIVSASRQGAAQTTAEAWIEPQPGMALSKVTVSGNDIHVIVSGEGELPPIAELEESMDEAMGEDVLVVVEYFPSFIVTEDDQ